MNQLEHSVTAYQAIRTRIIAIEQDIDDQTLADTLEGITDLHEVIAAVVRSALVEEAMIDGLKHHINVLQERMQRLTERAAARRELVRDTMIEVDLLKVIAPDFSINVRSGSPSVVVFEEASIPSSYWVYPEPRLDRARLLKDLKLGLSITGASLSNPEPVLSVRVR